MKTKRWAPSRASQLKTKHVMALFASGPELRIACITHVLETACTVKYCLCFGSLKCELRAKAAMPHSYTPVASEVGAKVERHVVTCRLRVDGLSQHFSSAHA